jgi:hypothetical protein
MAKNNSGNEAELGYINRGPDGTNTGYGMGGITGKKETWLGYEQGTVTIASDVLNRINTQNGIQPVDPNILAAREPFRVGRFLVKWVKAPPFFPEIAVRYLRFIFEDMVKELSGISDNQLEKIDVRNGATQAISSYPGIYHESGNTVTLKVTETSGMLVRKFLDYWISGISDRKTGVCHMYGAKMRGILPNKAGSILYVLLGPTCRPEDIEFACMWHEIIPYSEKVAHANSGTLGSAGDGVELDVEFAGIFDRGPEIDIFARKTVEGYNLYGQSFLNQLLPSYMYDPDLYAGADYTETNSVDIEDRLKNIRANAGENEIYKDTLTKVRNEQFRTEIPAIDINSEAATFGEYGAIDNGYITKIPDPALGATGASDNATTI